MLDKVRPWYDKWKQIQYYTIIGVVSLIALVFLPMLGTTVGLQWVIPNTTVGWIVYIITKLLVAGVNVLIFHCFVLQGKLNVKDDPRFLEAQQLLQEADDVETEKARSPKEWHSTVYGSKAISIFVTSIISAVGLTQAVLTFDWVSMLTYLFTLIMGLIFGVLQMSEVEIYWTEEYLRYARKTKELIERRKAEEATKREAEERLAMAQTEPIEQVDDTTDIDRGATVLVAIDSDRTSSNNS